MRSSGITSITDIKLTTTTIIDILLFQLIGLEIQIQIISPTGVLPTSWHWQRSMKIIYGGTWLTELMWSLIWIFGASWDGIWLRKKLMKRERMGGLMVDS